VVAIAEAPRRATHVPRRPRPSFRTRVGHQEVPRPSLSKTIRSAALGTRNAPDTKLRRGGCGAAFKPAAREAPTGLSDVGSIVETPRCG